MAKKHCAKHYRYVATCPDCRKLNDDQELEKKTFVSPEIPLYGNDNENLDDEIPPNRFHYIRRIPPGKKKQFLIAIIVIAIFAVIIAVWTIPLWIAKINLQQQLYSNKGGGDLDFWKIYTLNFWSTNFFFNKIGLIGAIIGCIIMSFPPENTLITLLGRKFGWGPVSRKKTLILWWTAGFVFFFIVGQAMETGYFALSMYMIQDGKVSFSFFKALLILNGNPSVSQLDVYIYNAITHPIITYILVLIAIRIIILIVKYSFLKEEYMLAASISFLIDIFFLMGLFGKPLEMLDGIDFIQIWSIYIGLILFLGLGIVFVTIGLKNRRINVTQFPRNIQKQAIVSAIVLIFIILIPVFISIPKNVSLSQFDGWKSIEWDQRYQRQIDWTRQAAGIDIGSNHMFKSYKINNYPNNVTVDDSEIMNVIRQYDKRISVETMTPIINVPYLTMADSDIIFIPNGTGEGEYWVAPKTIKIQQLDSAVKLHTEIYDHVEGFLALDTSTGQIVDSSDYEAIFGVPNDYPIFFGEREDQPTTASSLQDTSFITINAYENDILLGRQWNSTYNYRFSDDPDGTLSGLQAFWYTLDMGLTADAFASGEKEYLINRNIRTRINSVLMPGLTIDEDPYLVFDRQNGKMFYAVSIYTSIILGSYTRSHMYRFMGVVLVDVKSGELSWYRNPALQSFSTDNLGILWKSYANMYPWQDPQEWLMDQLRYPEYLWEKQLNVDYYYHVEDPTTWYAENNFYELPTDGDVFFIETDLGDGLEFVGVQLVEYKSKAAVKLAGLYIIRQGDHFGETIFYETLDSQQDLVGPKTAQEQLTTVATEKISLINNERYGNILLYPLAGSLYYFIPVYSATGEGYESFAMAGLVNAFDKNLLVYGDSLEEAYSDLQIILDLNETIENKTDDVRLDILSYDEEVIYNAENWAEIRTLVDYFNTSDTLPMRNFTLNITVRSAVNMSLKVSNELKSGVPYEFAPSITAYNYTLAIWNGTTGLNPGDLAGITIKMNTKDDLNADIRVYFKIDLIDLNDPSKISSTAWYSVLFRVST
ncbi:MAG: UPF0182 family protein [Promethearchaeota archaeon]